MQNPTFSLCALSLLWREMRGRCSVCLCNQTLTACQGKACRVKRLNCGLDFKRAKYDEVYSLSIKVACGCREMFWIKKQMPVHLFCTFNVFVCDFCSEKRFSGFCSQDCDNVEREQETARVCRATGQESQDKGKETQMEVLELKLSYIPKTQKTNIHQQGL